jgi:Fur family ferric uptake transcriptional regulator
VASVTTVVAELATPESVEGILALFRHRGGRVTASRRLVVRCLLASGTHPTADELVSAVHREDPTVHRSTVYRNLEELERLGVVEHVHLGHGAATYHLAADRHGHLVCDRCGRQIEVPEAVFDELTRIARDRYGFEVRPRHFAVPGLCRACAGQEAADPAGGPPATRA